MKKASEICGLSLSTGYVWIRKYGKTAKGTQRLECKTCERVFVMNKGTVFFARHHSPKEILECLAMLAYRKSLAAIHRIKGIKEETVMDWHREVANHVEDIEGFAFGLPSFNSCST